MTRLSALPVVRCVRCGDKTSKGGEDGGHYMYAHMVPKGSKFDIEQSGWHCDWCYRLILNGMAVNTSGEHDDRPEVSELEGLT
jgi:hypothetical protein